jgi:hypothetical protein
MKAVLPLVAILGVVGLLSSCGTQGGDEGAGTAAPQEGFNTRSGDMLEDDSAKIIARYGASNPMLDPSGQRKAAGENTMVNQQFAGDFSKQNYRGDLKDYEKRSFWGRKDYAAKVYGGDTDGGRFLREAREGAVAAREGSMTGNEAGRLFAAGEVDKPSARERGGRSIDKPSDAETDIRRRVFQQPEVRPWRPRRALEVEDTNAMLGR